MNPSRNPFVPAAGVQPPELVGRDALLERMAIATERMRLGRFAKSMVLVGLRGVGKTVLLDRMRHDAAKLGIETIRIEAPERRSLPAILAPRLRLALLNLSSSERAKESAIRALRALAGFVKGLRVKYNDIEVGLDYEPQRGLADNGDLDHDLHALLEASGQAARSAGTSIVLFIDELQNVGEAELAPLIMAMHGVAQQSLPVMLVGSGLPQIRGQMGRSKSYAERLFDFPSIGALPLADAKLAVSKPAADAGVAIDEDALDHIAAVTRGYAYFVQEWGKCAWDFARQSPITKRDVVAASTLATASLDESFFMVRFDRVTPQERKYLRAMAELGVGPHRSGEIARHLGRETNAMGPTRDQLIEKGMIWSPSHGETAFSVPMFDEFLKRAMPTVDG